MATASANEIVARARTIATQTMTDANQSTVIDAKGGLKALLNHSIREVWRRHSNDQKFIRDTVTRQTVTIVTGTGACPDSIMREFLHQAQFQDDNDSLISYYNYNIDFDSGTNYDQLGYVVMRGDDFYYRAPSPDLSDYSGNLFVTVPSFPTLPASMADDITFPSETAIDDTVLFLAQAILGKEAYQVVTV